MSRDGTVQNYDDTVYKYFVSTPFARRSLEAVAEAIHTITCTACDTSHIEMANLVMRHLEHLLCQQDFFTIVDPCDRLSEQDVRLLALALWKVLSSQFTEDTVGIASTIPGIHGRSHAFDFADQYADEMFYGARKGSGDLYIDKALAGFILSCVREVHQEWFSIGDFVSHLEECGRSGSADEAHIERAILKCIRTISVLEDVARRTVSETARQITESWGMNGA